VAAVRRWVWGFVRRDVYLAIAIFAAGFDPDRTVEGELERLYAGELRHTFGGAK
jgi:hypothetical protein